MKTVLLTDIGLLAGVGTVDAPLRGAALAHLATLENAWICVRGERILSYGSMDHLADDIRRSAEEIQSMQGATILPTWCDSHSHLVFAETREHEFVYKLQGMSYAEIAARGGGILHSAEKLAALSEDELFERAAWRLDAVARMGTGALEIKSGYGLSVEAELKMLRVIRRLQQSSPVMIRSTFLGAHALPRSFQDRREDYIQSIIQEMLPAIASEGLADYIDVFCETGFFSPDDMACVVEAGARYGLKPKLHINQLNSIGGLQRAIALNALSVDHLETMTDQDLQDLAQSSTIGTLLPTAAFFLRMNYQPARALIDSGAAIALASDYNPGSSPSANMHFVVALSSIQMKMLPEEAIQAATIQGAFAMELADQVGTIHPGKYANLQVMPPMKSLAFIPYSFGQNPIQRVMLRGDWL